MQLDIFKKRVKEVGLFSLPIIAGQVGQMLFGIGDIIVSGHYSTEAVSAIGIAAGIISPFIMVGLGLIFAVTPMISQMRSRGENTEKALSTSYSIAIKSSLILCALLLVFTLCIPFIGFEKNITDLVQSYLFICNLSLIPSIHFQVSKEYLQAYEKTFFANGLVLIFNIINIAFNIIFMFGYFGIPELGINGAAIATLTSRTLMAIFIYIYVKRYYFIPKEKDEAISKQLISQGLPISGSVLIEVMVFSTVTVLIGKMGVLQSAAHNIALNIAALTFMVPMGMASAASVKVGKEYGHNSGFGVLNYALATLFIIFCYSCTTALTYFAIPTKIIALATTDLEVIKAGAGLLLIVGLFQIPDGIQVSLMGILRGMNTTKLPMIVAFSSNWLFGLPIGCYLAYYKGLEATGLWIGLSIGLAGMSLGLSYIFYHQYKKLPYGQQTTS